MAREIYVSLCRSKYSGMRISRGWGYRLCYSSILGLVLIIALAVYPMPMHDGAVKADAGVAKPSASSITLATAAASTSVNLIPGAGFKLSDSNTTAGFGVTTDNFTGYNISLAAADDAQTLVNTDNHGFTISSISTPVLQANFVNTNSALMNRWGIKPNKYYDSSSSTTISNTTTILPAPTTAGTMLDVTNTANGTANNYSVALGAMIDGDKPAGTYNRVTTLRVTPNPIYYTLNYDKNTTDAVTNLPAAQNGSTTATKIVIDSATPSRDNYIFTGWCNGTTTTTDNVDSCAGTVFQPGDDFGIDQTINNTTTLYAMWKIEAYAVTYGTTAGISKVTLDGQDCTTALSSGGCTKTLIYNQTYDLKATISDGYSFSSWDAGDYGVVADTGDTGATTTFIVGSGATTITPAAVGNEYKITYLGSEIATGLENTSYSLTTRGDGIDFRPVVTSNTLNLATDTTYVLSYDYISDVDGDSAHTDIFPDQLPDRPFDTSTTKQHTDWYLSSSQSAMSNSNVRFFDDRDHKTIAATTTISNIMLSEPNVQTKTYGAALGTLPSYTKPGYTFVGWYTEPGGQGTQISSSTAVPLGDTTYYAHWTTNTYTITYGTVTGISSVTLDNQTCTTALSAGGCTMTLPHDKNYGISAVAATGYSLDSWDVGADGETKEIEWSRSRGSLTEYVMEYLEYSPTDSGYVPMRFKVGGTTTITPVVKLNTYDITIKPTAGISKITLNGTECSNTSGCVVSGLTYNSTYNLSATVATGYTFSSWNAGSYGTVAATGNVSTTYKVGAGDSTITASATGNSYTMTFLAGEITTGYEGRTVSLVSNKNDLPKDFSTAVTLNLATNTNYTISFDYVATFTNAFNVDLFPDTLPEIAPTATTTKQHRDWTTSSASSDMSSCTLRFFDNQNYKNESGTTTITNVMMSRPTTQTKTYGTTFGTLPTATKSGYTFSGWYTGPGGTGTRITTSTAVPAANTTYYGHWTKN